MNIQKLKALIPAAFDYAYVDANGETRTEPITLELNRMSFGVSSSIVFREAMENVDKDARPIAELLSSLIAVWNLFEDDDEKVRLAVNADSIAALPTDFVGQLAECVFAKLFANPQSAAASDNTSEPQASSTAA